MVLFASTAAPFMPRRPVPLPLAEDARHNSGKVSQECDRRLHGAGKAGAASLPRLREACPCLKKRPGWRSIAVVIADSPGHQRGCS